MFTVSHTNVLSTYLSDWIMKIKLLHQHRNPQMIVSNYHHVFQAIAICERDINTLLRLIDERLIILEKRSVPTIETINKMDFIVDVETVVLLKALYYEIRIYLDAISGVIRCFHCKQSLPKSFSDLLKKQATQKIPVDLSRVLSSASKWFNDFKETRDNLVHNYEDFLLLFEQKGVHHASIYKNQDNKAFDYGLIKLCIGKLLNNIQVMIDDLLDYFDGKFLDWFGFVQSPNSRNRTISSNGFILYWANKYGGYKHAALHIDGEHINQ